MDAGDLCHSTRACCSAHGVNLVCHHSSCGECGNGHGGSAIAVITATHIAWNQQINKSANQQIVRGRLTVIDKQQ
jgi:hypothetical protein